MAVRVSPRSGLRAMVLSGIIALCSCAGADEEGLIVATNLSETETRRIEAALNDPAIRVVWIRMAEFRDPATVVDRGAGVDVVLGAPVESLQRLAQRGRLEPLGGGSNWISLQTTEVGLAVVRGETKPPAFAAVTLDDPRRSPVVLAALRAILNEKGWGAGYRAVLAAAAHRPLIGAHAGEGPARLLRGEIPVALTRLDRLPERCEFLPAVPSIDLEEGVGIVRDTPHLDAARKFVAMIERQRNTASPPTRDQRPIPQVLLPELLGAVLVDAQPELIDAMAAVKAGGLETQAEKWFTPPPWPPASIVRLKRSDPSGALVESLAEQMVPDLKARVWLLESWNRTIRPIDGDLLRELTAAADGRLIAEPRFRAWLAVEWRTWARQCYRRVIREARRVRG